MIISLCLNLNYLKNDREISFKFLLGPILPKCWKDFCHGCGQTVNLNYVISGKLVNNISYIGEKKFTKITVFY